MSANGEWLFSCLGGSEQIGQYSKGCERLVEIPSELASMTSKFRRNLTSLLSRKSIGKFLDVEQGGHKFIFSEKLKTDVHFLEAQSHN
jgi:hypothetical protein